MASETGPKFTNRLKDSLSPYLLQHKHNPVAWYPWGEEALGRARTENKPIFLSIGYTACHWCHVMEKESFEDEETAKILNEKFVAIKVDREERPDLDQIYMAATQAISGSGGWPMSVFLTPDLKPFFAGTYFPPDDRYGRPGFKKLLLHLTRVFREERDRVEQIALQIGEEISRHLSVSGTKKDLDLTLIDTAATRLMQNFDRVHGGFGAAPKFPHPTDLLFLLGYASRKNDRDMKRAVNYSLKKMAAGGIYDHIGGGFHRYSVDERWKVPHFEKMLYDNALLAVTYARAWQDTGDETFREVVRGTLDFVLREMAAPEGGFYSSLDADSEGQEGKFYLWRKEEIDSLLKSDAGLFGRYYNVLSNGNFEEGGNILFVDDGSELWIKESGIPVEEFYRIIKSGRNILLETRSRRIRPGTDDKILTSWNGLMISGLAAGYEVTGDERYKEAALKAARFVREKMYAGERLLHSYRDGRTLAGPFLEDYAYFIGGLIDLYEIDFDWEGMQWAEKLAQDAVRLFSDNSGNLFLAAERAHEHYIPPRDIYDSALPSPGSNLIQDLIRLAEITGHSDLRQKAETSLAAVSAPLSETPYGLISAVTAFEMTSGFTTQIVLVGKDKRDGFLKEIYSRYIPHRVLVVSDKGVEKIPLLEGRLFSGKTRAYICRDFVCEKPVELPQGLAAQLDSIVGR